MGREGEGPEGWAAVGPRGRVGERKREIATGPCGPGQPLTLAYATPNPQDSAHFSNDLGLDSLDQVEVVMAIEDVCTLRIRESCGVLC